ncbi:TetR/AcrR family transcriptional regulator [uncultured Shewanella sp.]|uniref:TetR/AcrR family transcriptional regulator n=1 Tax=uncultured Shewanella sp. TaxID=173975 RepID=UPI00261508F4|nr:TetR/AcrR family transcriptional regulator [uncultured Shewanella sp.]
MVNTPPSTQGRGRPRVFNREKALQLALELFWQKSYEQVSIAELCKVLKINPPSLYSAFGNKANLFTEALNFYREQYWQPTWKALDNEPDIFTGIRHFFENAVDNLLKHPQAKGCLVVQVSAAMPSDDTIQHLITNMRAQNTLGFETRLAKGIADKQLDASLNIKEITTIYSTLMDGMAVQARVGQPKSILLQHAEYAVQLLKKPI